jgi:hypothetical protein
MNTRITHGIFAPTLAIAVALSAAALELAGCGSSSPSPVGTSVSAETACSDLAAARCARLAACSATVFSERYADEATCATREKALCLNNLGAPSTGGSPARTEGCVAVVPLWSCNDFFENVPPPACAPAQGSLQNGAGCGFSGQCQSAFCDVGLDALCGRCAPPASVGDSCAGGLGCGPGLFCASDTQKCVAFGTVGQACNDVDREFCAPGLVCLGASGTARDGTCRPASATVGAACSATTGCDLRAGLSCSGNSKTCVKVTPAGANQPCGTIDKTFVPCADDGLCDAAPGQPGVCVPAAGDGQPCDSAKGPSCLLPARCVTVPPATSGVCAMPSASSCS